MADRIANQVTYSIQIELAHDVGPVSLDRSNADVQGRRHLLVGLALHEELNDFPFARAQAVAPFSTDLSVSR